MGGFLNFLKSPKYDDEKHILKHLSDWKDKLGLYANNLRSDNETLRALLVGILPKDTKNRMIKKPQKYPNWQAILQHIKAKMKWIRPQGF